MVDAVDCSVFGARESIPSRPAHPCALSRPWSAAQTGHACLGLCPLASCWHPASHASRRAPPPRAASFSAHTHKGIGAAQPSRRPLCLLRTPARPPRPALQPYLAMHDARVELAIFSRHHQLCQGLTPAHQKSVCRWALATHAGGVQREYLLLLLLLLGGIRLGLFRLCSWLCG